MLPTDTFGNAAGVPIDLAVADYTAPTVDANNDITGGADFTVRPWVNWRDSDLFNRDVDFPFNVEKAAGHVVVSAWLDFVAPPTAFAGGESTPDYPYQRLKDGEASSCRAIVSTPARAPADIRHDELGTRSDWGRANLNQRHKLSQKNEWILELGS